MSYSDVDLEKEFPKTERKCAYCKKKFMSRWDTRYCSDSCVRKLIAQNHKAYLKRYLKSQGYRADTGRKEKK